MAGDWPADSRAPGDPRGFFALGGATADREPGRRTRETSHDFSGFAPALHRMQYPAPGAPSLARRAVELLAQSGIDAATDPARGLDHGAWVPLLAMFPRAHVPVTQLAPLRDEGVLILASGAITHNFDWLDWRAGAAAAPQPQAAAFAEWVADYIAGPHALQAYRSAPHGAAAHPSEEHFLPLFVAAGAANDDPPVRHRAGWSYAGLAMDAYLWK